jgi:hypothetical protein
MCCEIIVALIVSSPFRCSLFYEKSWNSACISRISLPGHAPGIVRDLPADPESGVAHRAAHRVDCIPGHEALEPRDLAACLFIGKPKPDQREAEDPVAFHEKFRTAFPLLCETDPMIWDMREKSGTCEFANRLCYGGRVNMKPGCDITGLYRAAPFEYVFKVPDFFWRESETVTVLHIPEYAGDPEKILV